MKLAGCIKHTKTSSVSKDQGKFGFSCHDPFNIGIAYSSQHLKWIKKSCPKTRTHFGFRLLGQL